MDRNQTIGLFLIMLLLVVYWVYMSKTYEKRAQQLKKQKLTAKVDTAKKAVDTSQVVQAIHNVAKNGVDTSSDTVLMEKYGGFGLQAVGKEQFITLQNNKIKIRFTNKGARPYSVQVLGYKTYYGKPLILFYGKKNKFSITFSANNRPISTGMFYFKPLTKDTLLQATKTAQKLVYRLYYSPDKWVDFIYSLEPNSYLLKFNVVFHNLNGIVPMNTTFVDLYWKAYWPSLEHGNKFEYTQMNIFYKYYQSDVDHLSIRKDNVSEHITTKLRWVAYKHQFFSAVLIAYDYFNEAVLSKQKSDDPRFMKVFSSHIEVPFEIANQDSIRLAYYFGPNKYSILKRIKLKAGDNLQLVQLIPLGKGLIRAINKFFIIPLFTFLGHFIKNYGIIILIMTIIIKLILSPLTFKTYMSSAKMKILKPIVEEMTANEKDQMKKQQKMMEIYKSAGVSPFGGCLPLLIQLPILIAMYRFFPASIELRQQSFLWVKDLSTYDAILQWHFRIPFIGDHISLFALLMALAMYFSTKLNSQPTADDPTARSMRFMTWLMPLLMFVWFNDYSAALSYYYFLINIFTIGQIFLIQKFIDEDKLLEQMKENIRKIGRASCRERV